VFAWGQKNRLGIHVESGIPIDFFATSEPCWFNSLVCRTGGIENNLLITTTAQHRGWSFEAYGSGFKNPRGERHDTTSEQDVYGFLGLPYLEPNRRK
jgi:DNA polymerase/3'-5' exonuclease PolX